MNRRGFNDRGCRYTRATVTGVTSQRCYKFSILMAEPAFNPMAVPCENFGWQVSLQRGVGGTRQSFAALPWLPTTAAGRDPAMRSSTGIRGSSREGRRLGHFPGAQLGQDATGLLICASPREGGRPGGRCLPLGLEPPRHVDAQEKSYFSARTGLSGHQQRHAGAMFRAPRVQPRRIHPTRPFVC